MPDAARPFYRQAGKLILQAGILSARDIPTLISYAEAQCELLMIHHIIDVEGRFQPSAFGSKPHPALTERRHLQNLVRQYQAALGFGPASRLKVQPPVEESSSSVSSRPQARQA
jgi:phage terminase small subunit